MQKVISIHLNGHAYQLEESGYETLAAYLERAGRQLAGNPDRAEIMLDLEQAIADRCHGVLGPHKTVVTAAEIDAILTQMGPVDPPEPAGAGNTTAPGEATRDAGAPSGDAPGQAGAAAADEPIRRLYRIPEGALLAGVCNGLAAYFKVDVTIIRVAFVIMGLLTRGAGIVAYVIMALVIPEASTAQEKAAASGAPLNARDIVDRAKAGYTAGTRRLRREWRRQWRRYGQPGTGPYAYGPPPPLAFLLPVFGLAHVALFVVMAAVVISLVNHGGVLGWMLPPDIPLWAAVLIVFIGYQILVAPFRAAAMWGTPAAPGGAPALFAFWQGLAWLIGLAFVVWIASDHVPEIREFLQRMPEVFREFIQAMRRVLSRG
jgi:phage shock protein PspC (stress-responsive transcriptional regulator)